MSVTQEANGRRSLAVEFEAAGTPDEVWQAIATGPGISSWFVPAEIEQRNGKPVAVTYHFSPEMPIRGELTAWDPPRMFAAQQAEGWGDAPPMTTEWFVEARAGGVCVVRMVHSLFASTDAWDDQLEQATEGWSGFLVNLRVYLKHFRGQEHSAIMQVVAPVAGPDATSWEALTAALQLQGMAAGQRWSTPAGSPALSGVLEHVHENPYDILVRLDTPGPGIAALGAATYPGGQSVVAMNLYLYGDQADDTVTRETPRWQAWFAARFPQNANASG